MDLSSKEGKKNEIFNQNKITEYFVRANIYHYVTETVFFPMKISYIYDSDWEMRLGSEV